jgi:antitoxin component YwqK of YwqJK toxin-antitoxin module
VILILSNSMKLILHLFFFLTISTKLFAQAPTSKDKVIYLDSTWVESTPDNYKYIRVIEGYYSNQKTYVFKEYFRSKKLKTIGATSDRDILQEEGPILYYYENGNKKLSVTYSKRKKTGREFNWYENGNLKSELDYFETKKGEVQFKVNNYWNLNKEQTVINGNGKVEDTSNQLEQNGIIKDGFPDGEWKGKNLKRKYTFTENYENGKLISGTSIDSLNVEHQYKTISERPVPKKGIDSFYRYFSRNMVIPVEARNKVSGKIYLSFIVDAEGNLVNPRILKGLGYGLDESAIAVIAGSEKWIPGIERGIPSRALYSIPITIVKNGL